jgi:HPt (histidine-containing phosphotransfer) domain-containing protein
MPEMGGLEATERIRAEEQDRGTRVPIIALTARASGAKRERCLAAGMDSYLSKPFQPKSLAATIEEVLSAQRQTAPPAAARSAATPSPPPPIDPQVWRRELLLERLAGDEASVRELVDLFLGDSTQILADLREAVGRRDAQAIEQAAHRLKGSASVLDAGAVRAAAETLEHLGASNDLASTPEAWARLEREAARLREALLRPPA